MSSPASSSYTQSRPNIKRICIFSDGSWMDPEVPTPTNILRLVQLVKPVAPDGTHQLVFYDQGVGTGDTVTDIALGGAFGRGIDRNITQLYTLLATNYVPGDEIYLFGFSRGAYTVRSLAGLINMSGLVRRASIDWIKEAYELYREKVDPESERAKDFRGVHGERVPIKGIICFDTVASLGLPFRLPWPISLIFNRKRYQFHNTILSESIEHAIHLLSVDEDKKSFAPILMTPNSKRGAEQLTQYYFPGGHGGVGGGNHRQIKLSENTLRFVVNEMARRGLQLAFREEDVPIGGEVGDEVEDFGPFHVVRIIRFLTGTRTRVINSLEECHESVLNRYRMVKSWRPPSLKPHEDQLQNILHRDGYMTFE